MKRVLRVVLLGPITVLGLVLFTIVTPPVYAISWMLGDPFAETPREFIASMWREGFSIVWNGVAAQP